MDATRKTRWMIQWLRVAFLVAVMAMLGAAMRWERHRVARLDDGPDQYFSGPQFVEGTTYDGFGRRLGRIYDVYSLSPLAASERDCKT